MKRREIDYSLYLVTDRVLAGGRCLDEIVRQSIEGGVTVVQLREKNLGTRDFLARAVALRRVTCEMGIPLIINDRVDIALACEADGVHLGQEDMDSATARRLVGKNMIIGVSVNTPKEAMEAEGAGADYLGAGPVFATPTKTDTSPPTGLSGIGEIRRVVGLPLVAIGGISSANAGEIVRCGADGVAVVSAIIASKHPGLSAREILAEVGKARSG
ncbi:MAG: thiamine phosphate synthase [Syntrophobacter sp.]